MRRTHTLLLFSFLLIILATGAIILWPTIQNTLYGKTPVVTPGVLGTESDRVIPPPDVPNKVHFDSVSSSGITSKTPTPTAVVLPMPDAHTILVIQVPEEITEKENTAFTWEVRGPAKTIHTTTVYFGTMSSPGTLATSVEPGSTHYTDSVRDFMHGDFAVPLRYIGNVILPTPGTYYYRAYALIDSKHYWSPEGSFVVKELPKHEIKIVNHPTTLSAGVITAFTWEILGPATTTGFTAIVGGRQSQPGTLDISVDLPKTPYSIMASDFISGTYAVPLRFIGNAKITERGVYYFRGLAYINGKNIWSDEYSFSVE